MLKARQAVVLISCLHSLMLCSIPRNLCPRPLWRPPGASLSSSACSAMYVFAAFPASAHVTVALAHACRDSSALARRGGRASHLCPAGSKCRSPQHSFLHSKHNPRWGFFFSFLLSCRKESIKGHSVSPHGLDEARVGLENNNSPV